MPSVRRLVPLIVLASSVLVLPYQATPSASAWAGHGPGSNPAPAVVPAVQEWSGGTGAFQLTPHSRVLVEDQELMGRARTFVADLEQLTGEQLAVSHGRARAGDLVLSLNDGGPSNAEGYTVEIGGTLELGARTALGVSRGAQTVLQLFALDEHHISAPRGTIQDWPVVAERGFMLDTGRKYYQPSYVEEQIRLAAWYRMNTVHLHLTEWNAFRLDSPRFPGLAADDGAYDRQDIARFEEIAAEYDVTILPEIDLPAHATQITDYWPQTRWDCPGMNNERGRNFTVDVTEPATRDVVEDLLDEFVPWFSGPRFHIGADEYPYRATQEACPELVEYARQNGFAKTDDVMVDFINFMNDIVRGHGKQSVAWGWWDAAGDPSAGPNKNIVVEAYGDDVFADGTSGAQHFLDEGYDVIYADGNQLYVTPGLALLPDNSALYADWPTRENLRGYLMSRWSDDTETESDRFQDWFAHRAQQVTADRMWGAPPDGTHLDLETRADAIGPPPGLVRASSGVSADAVEVTGEPYGSTPPFDPTTGFEQALDGDPATFFDHSQPNGGYVGIDAGTATRVTKARILPRSGSPTHRNRMIDGVIQGCTDGPTAGCVDLATVDWQPPGFDWVPLPVYDTGRYRWLRYLSPDDGFVNIAELEFYTEPQREVAVTVDTSPSFAALGREIVRATVRNTSQDRIRDVELDALVISLDDGRQLDIRQRGATRISSLRPREQRTVTWTVDVPLDVAADDYRVTSTATWRRAGSTGVGRERATASTRVVVAPAVTAELVPDTMAVEPDGTQTASVRITNHSAESVRTTWRAVSPDSRLSVSPRGGEQTIARGAVADLTVRVAADAQWSGSVEIPVEVSATAQGQRVDAAAASLRVTDGRLYLDGNSMLARPGADWTDYDYQFSATPFQTGGGGSYAQAGWFFRATDAGTSYVWIIGNYPHPGAEGGNLTKVVLQDGDYVSVEVVPLPFDILAEEAYEVRMSLRGEVLSTYVNGTLVDETTDGTHTRGRVGFRQDGTESASFDDVLVTAPDGTVLFEEDFSGDLSRWEAP